ncbi:MAG TPA: TIR domain-containing protein [Anaerolineae bacterium]|nr:TIR domain-containing protein [Anaerolineae bacterium]
MPENRRHLYDLFISFAGEDRGWVKGYLLRELGLSGERVITRDDFRLGAPLLGEIERAVTTSRYTLLILSPAYLADEWSAFGENLASYLNIRDQRERLIPLQRKPCDLSLAVDFLVRLDCVEEDSWADQVARLRALLAAPDPLRAAPRCPYPGLESFSAENADRFYGREEEVRKILQHLRHHHFLAAIGSSGSGKSSLIAAGVLPKLLNGNDFPANFWTVRTMRPGSQPWQSLAETLAGDPGQPHEAVDALLAAHSSTQRLLLVIDQFEELFTQSERPEQVRFIAALKELRQQQNCAVVIAVRADFYSDLMESDLWPIDSSQRVEIAPLRGGALRAAIERPAQDVGVFLETSLVDSLLADAANEPGILPMLQETLVLLWGQLQRLYLPGRAYRDLCSEGKCGLAVAMQAKADATWVALSDRQQRIARRIFLRLIQLGQGRADTRRQQCVAGLLAADDDPQVFEHTLCRLVDNRLLTLSGEEAELHSRKVDIAHEALISGWPRLADWIQESRRALETWDWLEAQAAKWLAHNRQAGLLDDIELRDAENWLQGPDAAELGYSHALEQLVAASRRAIEARERAEREAQERELALERGRTEVERLRADEERRSRKRITILAVAVAAVAVFAVVAAVLALKWNSEAQTAKQKAQDQLAEAQRHESLFFTKQAQESLPTDAVTSLYHSANALSGLSAVRPRPYVAEAELALTQAMAAIQERGYRMVAKNLQAAERVAFGPHGIAIGGDAAHLVAPDLSTIVPLPEGVDVVQEVAWSDGGELLMGLTSAAIRVWDSLGLKLAEYKFSEDTTLGIDAYVQLYPMSKGHCERWRPARDEILICSGRSLVLWTPASGARRMISELPSRILGARWSEDGQHLAAWDKDNQLRIWSAGSGTSQPVSTDHPGPIVDAAWAPDNALLVTVSDGVSNTVRITSASNVDSARYLHVGRRGTAGVEFVDPERFVTWEVMGNIHLWSTEASELDSLAVRDGGLQTVDFSPDRTMLLASTNSGRAILGRLDSQTISPDNLDGHTRRVSSVLWGDRYLVTGSQDGTARIWSLEAYPPLIAVLHGHHPESSESRTDRADVLGAQWQDERHLVTAGVDGSLRRWEVFNNEGDPLCLPVEGAPVCRSYSPMPQPVQDDNPPVKSAHWLGDDAILFTDSNGGVGQMTRSTGQSQYYANDSGSPRKAAWSPDGRHVLTYALDDADTPALVREFASWSVATESIAGPIVKIYWLNNDLILVSRESEEELVDIANHTRQPLPRPSGTESTISAAQLMGKQLAVARINGEFGIFNYETGEWIYTSPKPTNASAVVHDVTWSPNGDKLLAAGPGTLTLWQDGPGGKSPLELPLEDAAGQPIEAQFSPDGRYIVAAVAHDLIVFDAATGAEVARKYWAHEDAVEEVQWLVAPAWPDDVPSISCSYANGAVRSQDADQCRLLVLSRAGDGTVRVWHLDLVSQANEARLIEIRRVVDVDRPDAYSAGFLAADMRSDLSYLLTVNYEGVLRVWQTWISDPQGLITETSALLKLAKERSRVP